MRKRILIIDDEKIIRDTLKKILLMDGYEVYTEENAIEGLRFLEERKADQPGFINIVILDVKMPKMNGIDALKTIKEEYGDIEVIMTTGHGSVEIAIDALRLGAFDYIQKPIDFDELNIAIIRAMESQRNTRRRVAAERAMKASEEKYRMVVEQASDGIVIVQDNLLKYVNPRFEKFMGYSAEDLLETSLLSYIHARDLSHTRDYLIRGEVGNHEMVLVNKAGGKIYVELNASEIIYEECDAKLVMLRDVTDRKKSEERIRYLTFHDKLTGLYNRAYFEEEIKRLDTNRQLPLSIIMADMNGLKMTNDGFGHFMGDKLLVEAARIFRRTCRKEDIISRWGGDEFIILLPQVSEEDAQTICGRIKAQCDQITHLPIKVSVSMGVASKKSEGQNIQSLIREAEDNMYTNKLISCQDVNCSIIASLKKELYDKNCETESHCIRLENMCREMGVRLNLSDDMINTLLLLGGLHDIGKVGISNEILNKPGPLTDDEWKEVQRHSEIGYRIANANSEIMHIAEGILYHHERWDGKGYPSGLKREKIPLEARVVAIADAYDAMTNNRPYRKGCSREEAIDELVRNKGTQFDPHLVDVFINMLRDQEKAESRIIS